MSSDIFLMEYILLRKILRRRRRKMYIRDIFKNRTVHGETHLLDELEFDEEYHHKYLRMSKESFAYILNRIEPRIAHTRNHKYPISAKTRLAITLRFLATGASYTTLAFSFRVSPTSVLTIIREVLSAIWEEFKDEYLPHPTADTWKKNSSGFKNKWNFENCVGALDGKHVRVKNFAGGGSQNFNYKKFFSLVLLASVDPNYKFTVVIIGAHGSESDSGVLEESPFGQQLYANTLPLPTPTPTTAGSLPYVFIGDQGFPLRVNLMTPYSLRVSMTLAEKIFNYRLSRARRIVENAFGILAARWRIFHTPIDAKEDLVILIIQATTILHNFLTSKSDKCVPLTADREENGEFIPGSWRDEIRGDTGLVDGERIGSNNYGASARRIREAFTNYFSSVEGSVPWQNAYVTRGE